MDGQMFFHLVILSSMYLENVKVVILGQDPYPNPG